MAPDPQPRHGSSVEATKAIHVTARNSKPSIPPKVGILQNENMTRVPRSLSTSLLVSLVAILNPVSGQSPPSAQHTERPTPPTRNPNSPGYVRAQDLPDGSNPPANADGNFIIGPTHDVPPEMSVQDGIPRGTVTEFTMNSSDSKVYPGIARDPSTSGTIDPANPAKLVVTTSHPAPYTRRVSVYVPKQYVAGTPAPFIIAQDGGGYVKTLAPILDNMIQQQRVPVMWWNFRNALPVRWSHSAPTKVRWRHPLQMFVDLLRIRFRR